MTENHNRVIIIFYFFFVSKKKKTFEKLIIIHNNLVSLLHSFSFPTVPYFESILKTCKMASLLRRVHKFSNVSIQLRPRLFSNKTVYPLVRVKEFLMNNKDATEANDYISKKKVELLQTQKNIKLLEIIQNESYTKNDFWFKAGEYQNIDDKLLNYFYEKYIFACINNITQHSLDTTSKFYFLYNKVFEYTFTSKSPQTESTPQPPISFASPFTNYPILKSFFKSSFMDMIDFYFFKYGWNGKMNEDERERYIKGELGEPIKSFFYANAQVIQLFIDNHEKELRQKYANKSNEKLSEYSEKDLEALIKDERKELEIYVVHIIETAFFVSDNLKKFYDQLINIVEKVQSFQNEFSYLKEYEIDLIQRYNNNEENVEELVMKMVKNAKKDRKLSCYDVLDVSSPFFIQFLYNSPLTIEQRVNNLIEQGEKKFIDSIKNSNFSINNIVYEHLEEGDSINPSEKNLKELPYLVEIKNSNAILLPSLQPINCPDLISFIEDKYNEESLEINDQLYAMSSNNIFNNQKFFPNSLVANIDISFDSELKLKSYGEKPQKSFGLFGMFKFGDNEEIIRSKNRIVVQACLNGISPFKWKVVFFESSK